MLRLTSARIIAAVLAVVTLPLGSHRAASWLIKLSSNIGKLTVFCGWRYEEYSRV